jgi:hypothetical protein
LQDNISSLADAKPRVIFASAMIASTICGLVALLPAIGCCRVNQSGDVYGQDSHLRSCWSQFGI